jgi:hypothetical protein
MIPEVKRPALPATTGKEVVMRRVQVLTSPSNFSKREHAAVKYGSRFAPSHGSVDRRQEKPMKEGRR